MEPDTNGVPVPPELQSLLDRGVITWRQLGQLMGHPDMPRPAGPDAVAASRTVWLRPECVWRELRLQDIQAAVVRCKAAGIEVVPNDWIVELADHVRWIKARSSQLPPELEELVARVEMEASAHERRTCPAVEPVDEVTAGIIQQIYEALTALGADSRLLAVVGSWRDTLPDLHVLAGLRAWNAQRAVAAPTMEQREPERQRALLTKEEWAMVERAGGLTSEGKGGQPS